MDSGTIRNLVFPCYVVFLLFVCDGAFELLRVEVFI